MLLLLLALPVIAYLRGNRGPAAALIFSSTAVLRGIGKASASRVGKFLTVAAASRAHSFRCCTRAPAARKNLESGPGQRHRHHDRARRLRIDADEGFYHRR